eukprot:gene45942-62228_t
MIDRIGAVPGDDVAALRDGITALLDPGTLDGIISMHLMESDPHLSRPLTDDPASPNPAARDWYVLIDGTDVGAVATVMSGRFDEAIDRTSSTLISSGTYVLMWDLAKSDLS